MTCRSAFPGLVWPCYALLIIPLSCIVLLCLAYNIWSRPPSLHPPSPPWVGSPGSTPLSLLFASYWQHFWGPASYLLYRSLQHFWLPASHLLGTCYLLGDLRSTHAPSKYLRATYSHIYMCYVSTSYLLPVYSHNTTWVEHMPYLPYIPMMPCVPYLWYLSYRPHIPYIWNNHMKQPLPCIQYQTYMPYIPYLPYIGNIPYPS